MSLLWPIVSQALCNPQRIAVVDDHRTFRFGQILGGAMFAAEEIDTKTSAPHIGILLPTGGTFHLSLLGTWLAGRVPVPLNYLLNRDELTYVIRDSDIDTIITVSSMIEFIGGRDTIPEDVQLLDLTELELSGLPPLRWPPLSHDDDLAVILYTSGTSGRPKGVMLTHGNLHSNVDAAIIHANITRADTFLGVLPQFHSFGLTALTLVPLRVGAKGIYSARFVPRRIVHLIREHRPNIMMAVPSMYGALLTVKEAVADDFKSIRLAVSGGEPLPQATFDAYRERLRLRLLEGYGLTETSPVTNWCTEHGFKHHSVGRALPGVTNLVVDEQDEPLSPDQEGEILIAGPNIMKGYYRQPQETSQVFVELPDPRNGLGTRYFRTGDMGRIDRDGFLFITGRKKEMLIIGGENVFPREIEEVLNRNESVGDSAVVGLSDDIRGEVPIAFVETKEGKTFDAGVLRTWCRQSLAPYKVPREIRQVESLPRNPTGKILRRQLMEELESHESGVESHRTEG